MSGLPLEQAVYYVAGAYIGMWLALLVYVIMLAGQVGKLRREVRLLVGMAEKTATQ